MWKWWWKKHIVWVDFEKFSWKVLRADFKKKILWWFLNLTLCWHCIILISIEAYLNEALQRKGWTVIFFLRHNSSPARKPCMLLAFQPFTGSSDTALATQKSTALFRGVPAAWMIYLVGSGRPFSLFCFLLHLPAPYLVLSSTVDIL